MVSSIPPANRVIIISSPIPVIPVPMAPNQSKIPKLPVAMPMMPLVNIPIMSTSITFIPAMAVPNTII